MIAKATPKGKSFRAIINYLFKGKLETRGKVEKQATVLSASQNLIVPRDNDDDEGILRLIAYFNYQALSHREYDSNTKAYVGHHIISRGCTLIKHIDNIRKLDVRIH